MVCPVLLSGSGFRYYRAAARPRTGCGVRAQLLASRPCILIRLMHPSLLALPFAATLGMAACAQPPGGTRDAVPPPGVGAAEVLERPGAPADPVVGADLAAAGGPGAGSGDSGAYIEADLLGGLREPPGLRGVEDLLLRLPGPKGRVSDGTGATAAGVSEQPGGDPVLREQVAERCASRPASITERSLLRRLALDLDAGGVDPALAVDALIAGRCGELADIVTEVVAQGGPDAAMPVIDRAIALTGRASALIVERAAAAGLLRAGRQRVARQPVVSPYLTATGGNYAMLYFPPGRELNAAPSGMSLVELLGNGEPGFGIYTYVLGVGAGGTANREGGGDVVRVAAYDELLRVLDSYVMAAASGTGVPVRGAHAFLVPVHADRAGAALVERTGPELSAAMRRALAAHLRRGRQPALAARVGTAPGPLLVSSLEPRLVPGSPDAVRMIVDLSGIGPEYMYSIVDAYDQEIPSKLAGRVESLLAVRRRLIELFPGDAVAGGAEAPAGDWVLMLGPPTITRAGRAGARVLTTDNRR